MARNTVTEESLGLNPSEEEMAVTTPPQDDDVSLGDDDPPVPAMVAPQDAPQPEAQKPAEKPVEEPKTVDLRALQEARAEAREAKQRAAVLEQRWNDFLAGSGKAKEPEKPAEQVPAFDADPLAAAKWTQEQLVELRQQNERSTAEQRQAQQAEEAFQRDFQRVNADFVTAEQADPTIREAYNALMASQGNELLAMGYSREQAQAELRKIERQHIQFVASRNLPIGDYLKALASARGWSAQPQPAPVQQKPDMAALAAAQQRHRSLSDAPGGDVPAPLDAKALARMSDKQFKAWMSQRGNEARFDEIMGR